VNPTRLLACAIFVPLLICATACQRGPEASRRELIRAGYQFTGPELVRAASQGDERAVGWFLSAGDLALIRRAVDAGGVTPLMAAVERGNAALVTRLLGAGVDVNARNAEGWTALMMAASFNENAACARLLVNAGADAQFRDGNGWTALMQAVYKGNAEVVELLAPRSRPDLDRALLVASLAGNHDVVRVLLDQGADRHAVTDEGDTPLHLAVRRGHAQVAILLLQRGADPGALNKRGENPRRLAARLGNAEVSALVDSRGAAPGGDGAAETEWLRANKFDPSQADALTGDADGDGASNREEFVAGTNPRNAASRPGPIFAARLTAYHGAEVPVVLEKISAAGASVRVGDAAPMQVKEGEQIPGQPYKVALARQRRTTDKEGLEVDVSELHLEEMATGARVVLVPGMRAKSPESYAEIQIPGTEAPLRIHQDEVFTPPGAGAERYRVIDLRDEQVVIRRVSDGRVVTIPATR
jgi:ankyrin repeat protein